MMKLFEHYLSRFKYTSPPSLFNITTFFRQFATLIAAGVPIIQSCDILEKSQAHKSMQHITHVIKTELQAGKTLHYALRQHPRQFNDLICQLVRISEYTGRLDTMLLLITAHLEKQLAHRQRTKQALLYPCLVASIGSLITLGMLLFVVPHFAELFHDMPGKLPLITQGIFFLSNVICCYGWIIPVSLIGSAFIIQRTDCWSFLVAKLKNYATHLPIIHTCWQKITFARFTHALAITLTAGINLTEALTLAADACSNPSFSQLITQTRNRVQAGFQLHQAMVTLPNMPPLLIDMIKVGEESGTLPHLLTKTSAFFDAEVERMFSTLSQLLEPLIMLMLGVLIGGVVISLYLPVFNLGSTI